MILASKAGAPLPARGDLVWLGPGLDHVDDVLEPQHGGNLGP